jgi:hypothetical protein
MPTERELNKQIAELKEQIEQLNIEKKYIADQVQRVFAYGQLVPKKCCEEVSKRRVDQAVEVVTFELRDTPCPECNTRPNEYDDDRDAEDDVDNAEYDD